MRVIGDKGVVQTVALEQGEATVTLPAGRYKLSFDGYRDDSGAYHHIPTVNSAYIRAEDTTRITPHYVTDDEEQQVEVYYTSWATYDRNHQVHHIDPRHVDVVYYAFMNVASNGEVELGDRYADVGQRLDKAVTPYGTYKAGQWGKQAKDFHGNLERLQQLKRIASENYNNDMDVVLSIGGWTWSGSFEEVAADPAKRERFADSAVAMVRKYKMDGLDIDWEFPVWGNQNEYIKAARKEIQQEAEAKGRKLTESERQAILDKHLHYEDAENYVKMVRLLRNKLDDLSNETGKEYHLSIAINQAPASTMVNSYSEMVPYVDSINLMSYDSVGAWGDTTGHQSPLSGAEGKLTPNYQASRGTWNLMDAVNGLREAGVPDSKIVAGMPIYGRHWQEVADKTAEGSSVAGLYQQGEAGDGEWEAGVLGYNCLMGQSFSESKTASFCSDFADTARQYTHIAVKDAQGDLIAVSNQGTVTANGYRVDGVLYRFDQIVESYYYNPETGIFVTYDSPTMINIKGRWIAQQDLGGGMFWDSSGDAPQPHKRRMPSLLATFAHSVADSDYNGVQK